MMPHPPTHVRWRILVLLLATVGMCHFNRLSISVAGTEHIMKEYSISESDMGLVYSSYLFAYTLCMTPGGWLIDRFGPKKALMVLGFGSAILVPMTGLAGLVQGGGMLVSLCCIRSALGVVSTATHPGSARAVSFWIPYPMRGMANGMVTAASLLGIAATPFAFGTLMDGVGWKTAFVVAGIATLVLAFVWSIYATDNPFRHSGVNEAERELIEAGDPLRQLSSERSNDKIDANRPRGEFDGGGPIFAMLRNRNLVLLTISYATVSYFQYLFFYWMQFYFDKVLGLGKDDGRLYSTITNLAMAAGMLSGGWLADRVQLQFGRRRGRAITPFCGMLASAVLLILGILSTETAWVVSCFALAMGALGASESSFWTTGIEIGKERGGLSAAILNTGGNAGGIPAPYLTPLISTFLPWQAGLGLASALCLFGAFLWFWIDPDENQNRTNPELDEPMGTSL